MEISQASIKNCPVETKTKLTDDLFRLLQVRDKNQDMAKDWLLFLSTAPRFQKLTPGEIYLAFQLALSRELVDSKGNGFEMLPELSNNTTGKVLDAYLKFKKEDAAYNSAKDELKKAASSDLQPPTDTQKVSIRQRYLEGVFDELSAKNHCEDAWMLYDDVESRLTVTNDDKKRLYAEQEKKYHDELKSDVNNPENYHRPNFKHALEGFVKDRDAGKKNAVVQNRCRSIVVSKYLLHHLSDFETFKNAIEGHEPSDQTRKVC